MSSLRAFNYSITINNWKQEDYDCIKSLNYRYLIVGKESKSKTPHLQCYIQLNNALSFSSMKKKLKTAHIEIAKSDTQTNINYCSKEGDYEEFGEAKKQGKRTDLDGIRQVAYEHGMRGVTLSGNLNEIQLAEKFLSHHEEPRKWKPNVFWIYGPTGAGKSRLARHIFKGTTDTEHPDIFVLHPVLSTDDPDPYTKSDPSKWWNGYDAHPNVIIDDFRPTWWPFTYLLSLLDRYECRVEIKGNVRQFKPKNIVVTSIESPEIIYGKISKHNPFTQGIKEPLEQLLRRVDELIKLDYYFESENTRCIDKAQFINRKLIDKDINLGRTEKKGVIDFTRSDDLQNKLFD